MFGDLQLIKDRILEEDRLEDIYEAMGCEFISVSGGRIEAQLHSRFHSNNKRAVQTKLNNSLSSAIRNRADFIGGDIFYLISYIHHDIRGNEENYRKDLPNSKKFICETLGWMEYLTGGNLKTKKDYVAPLKAILKKEGISKRREIIPNPVLPESIMNQYYINGKPLPYQGWIDEGISYHTQVMYGVGFDLESKRIVFPLRNRFGQIVGVKGRIMKDEDDDRKYLYLYCCNNSQELFNFHYAHPYILDKKRVYIFEGEKSCMKMFDNKIFNTVAIGSSSVTITQADMIMQCGLDVDIILCLDNDRSVEDITNVAKMFKGRNVYSIYDADGLLNEKQSPIDSGVDVFDKLEKDYCFKVNLGDV